ncbi:MAG: gephyrin-like molybdotransferase Glp [Amphiplicatus sp.]
MLTVDEALETIRSAAPPSPAEEVALAEASGRILAEDIVGALTQPPFAASAMDGYAVRFDEACKAGARLKLVGEARAGRGGALRLGPGEAIRIFTGGVVPDGADHVVIQEEAERDGDKVVIRAAQAECANIRRAGVDFKKGDVLKKKGVRLTPIDLALIAAANVARVKAARRPVVAYFDNGDELAEPGAALGPGEIVGSNRFAFEGLIADWGAQPRYLGRAADSPASILEKYETGADADIIVPIGGASVGAHDYVRAAFAEAGGALVFQKIAVKPGKPTWFGRLGSARVLGLPGNPASAIVCALLFLRPLIDAMSGAGSAMRFHAALEAPLRANGPRENYLRAAARLDTDGRVLVAPFPDQDSSLLLPLAGAGALIRRPSGAPAAGAGEIVECVALSPMGFGAA